MTIGSKQGVVSVWSTNDDLRENIFEVLDHMKTKPDFWRDFPIYYQKQDGYVFS